MSSEEMHTEICVVEAARVGLHPSTGRQDCSAEGNATVMHLGSQHGFLEEPHVCLICEEDSSTMSVVLYIQIADKDLKIPMI